MSRYSRHSALALSSLLCAVLAMTPAPSRGQEHFQLGPTSRTAADAQVSAGIMLYEMEVVAPGSKSQGLRGMLYDEQGRPRGDGSPLQPVHTQIGDFQYSGCTYLWSSCGFLRVEKGYHGPTGGNNNPMIGGATRFRVMVIATDAGQEMRGELLDAKGQVASERDTIDTPMGAFRRDVRSFYGQRWSGWLPAIWLEDK